MGKSVGGPIGPKGISNWPCRLCGSGGRGVAFAPDGRSLACAGYHMDKLVGVYDVRTGQRLRTLAGHTEIETYAIAFSPDGKLLASAGTYKQILVWELATGKEVRTLEGHTAGVESVAISPDGRFAISASTDKTLKLWKLWER